MEDHKSGHVELPYVVNRETVGFIVVDSLSTRRVGRIEAPFLYNTSFFDT